MTEAYDRDCTRCPRLAAFLRQTRHENPDYWARPVPSFGAAQPRLLIVGLAPGMHGANRTGRPFTGDHAGILLYGTLHEAGLATAPTSHSAQDALQLIDTRIANAVKCVPPQNKPLPAEIRACNAYLAEELRQLEGVRVLLALGRVAHDAVLMARGLPRGRYPFAHGREHALGTAQYLLDSYHCSRYNTATRRLTTEMFRAVVARACELAGLAAPRSQD
ncbi:MAG TPA: uracil-DNA glycosylase [Steroidobacteraceae bacterium]|nr:uracil-DNA glycosylase [Steroidobacteraceae bacterium]